MGDGVAPLDAGTVRRDSVVALLVVREGQTDWPRLFASFPTDLARPFLLRAPNTPDRNMGESAQVSGYNLLFTLNSVGCASRVANVNWPRSNDSFSRRAAFCCQSKS